MDPTNTSVISPPPGTSSNFVDPPDQLAAVYVTSALVLVLATVGLSARLFVKLFIIPGNRVEDWLSYLAYASFVAYVAVIIHLSRMGLTRHMYDITLAQIPSILYWTNIVYCIYSVPTAAAKLSVLFQLKSIFTTGARNSIYWVIVVSIVINIIFYLGLFFSYVFQCWPREKIWLGDTVEGKCTDAIQVNLSSGVLNIISDVEALLIPAWAIWHLSMPIKRKLAAFAVFGVSLIAIGTGIGGMYIRVVLLTNIDQTWWLTKLAMIVTTEISIVMFVGCMPFISRLYHHFRGPSLHATTAAASSSKGGVLTFGASGGKTGDGKLSRTVAKYMGSRGAGMTTLGSRGGGNSEDELELRGHVAMEDVERGDRAPSSHNIYKTSRGQTYTTRTEDWRGR
ncbi:unnamed protein product [Clonostachys byssicola]|uniref:Rhodopsin domain-containing protein n=1 Tax=Clonostachys byssicola TaxID=160290 RepID=A0A9N9U931_9HYPO|nr:unnamed protein product [Clonostachys byssicola]